MTARTIRVDTLARVEGEGSLYIKMAGDRVADVKLKIYEPPRLFEAFLRGRHYSEAPDITARICGICPVAYQMSAVHAIERALHIQVDPAVRLLRRLFYCGEWIESHALHIYMLHAPDFLGYQDAIAMAADHRDLVEKALRLKKIGNQIMSLLGGREIHPISVTVGGFYKVPTRTQLTTLAADLEWALQMSLETVQWTSSLEFPNFDQDYEFVALRHPDEYALNEGRLVSNRGLDIDAAEYEDHFIELHVKHSNALQSVVRGRGSYLVGPLARFNLNFDKLPDVARQSAINAHLQPPVRNPFRSIIVRAVELVFACSEALRVIREYEPPASPKVELPTRAGMGQAITEAPRGILYHRYAFNERGLILAAKIVPPTSQNQKRIEDDLREYAAQLAAWPQDEATWKCEQAIRNYDPCISCATHFVKVTLERNAAPERSTYADPLLRKS
jgi:coenzyme F420-reducing hydrogenase alpha subunit